MKRIPDLIKECRDFALENCQHSFTKYRKIIGLLISPEDWSKFNMAFDKFQIDHNRESFILETNLIAAKYKERV